MMRARELPLRLALLVPLVLVLSGTAGLICLINARNAQQSAEQLAFALQRHTTRVVSVFLSNELRGPQQAIQAMNDAVNSGLVDPHHEQETALYLSRLAQVFPNAPFLNYGLADGTFIGVGQAGNKRSPQRVLAITRPEAVLQTAQYRLEHDGRRGAMDYQQAITDFRQAPWYSQPLRAGHPIWTQIYHWDDQPEVMALGAGMPLRRDGRVIGVAGADMILANISTRLRQLAGNSGSVLYIVDHQGLLVASSSSSPPFDLIAGKARRRPARLDPDPWIRSSAQFTAQRLSPDSMPAAPLEIRMTAGRRHGLVRLTPWRDSRGLRWQIAMVTPESHYADIITTQTRHTLVITGLALLGACGVGWLVVGLVCRPLEAVALAAEKLAAGQPPQPLRSSLIAEIERLSDSFSRMATQMNQSLLRLQARHEAVERTIARRSDELTRTNTKLHEELNRAAVIQAEMLMEPERFAGLTPTLETAVRLVPSKEVSGDLYDAIPMGSDRICFCIGDVSGKGMPAALLMSTCLSLLRTYVELVDSPSTIMQRINQHLCESNEDCIFTTLLIAVYHAQSGELQYCNAGHNPSLLRRARGDIELIDTIHGPALGVNSGVEYGETRIRLDVDDTLIAYTDGANVTFNRHHQRYGLDRMRTYLAQASTSEAHALLQGLLRELDRFADGEPRHDDTTVMAIRRRASSPGDREQDSELRILIRNDLSGVAAALDQVKQFGQRQQIARGKLRNVLVVVDELLNNIVSHGCKQLGDKAHIELRVTKSDERLVIIFADNGIPFNPIERRAPDIASHSDERPIGGLGIHLMRGLTSASRYKYESAMNWLTLEM